MAKENTSQATVRSGSEFITNSTGCGYSANLSIQKERKKFPISVPYLKQNKTTPPRFTPHLKGPNCLWNSVPHTKFCEKTKGANSLD